MFGEIKSGEVVRKEEVIPLSPCWQQLRGFERPSARNPMHAQAVKVKEEARLSMGNFHTKDATSM